MDPDEIKPIQGTDFHEYVQFVAAQFNLDCWTEAEECTVTSGILVSCNFLI